MAARQCEHCGSFNIRPLSRFDPFAGDEDYFYNMPSRPARTYFAGPGESYSESRPESRDVPLQSLGPSSDLEREAGHECKESNKLDWDGPDDPENPQNWPTYKRRMQVILIALITLVK